MYIERGATPLLLPQLSYPQEAWQTDVSYTGLPSNSWSSSWFLDNCALLTMKWSTPITPYEAIPSEKVNGWHGVTEQCCDRNEFVPGPVFFWLSLLSDADVEQMLLKVFEWVILNSNTDIPTCMQLHGNSSTSPKHPANSLWLHLLSLQPKWIHCFAMCWLFTAAETVPETSLCAGNIPQLASHAIAPMGTWAALP